VCKKETENVVQGEVETETARNENNSPEEKFELVVVFKNVQHFL